MSDGIALNLPPISAAELDAESPDESELGRLGQIERQLLRDLPRLRAEYPNMWIAYGATGLLLPPHEDKGELLRQCQERGFSLDLYFLETGGPRPPSIITDVVL